MHKLLLPFCKIIPEINILISYNSFVKLCSFWILKEEIINSILKSYNIVSKKMILK